MRRRMLCKLSVLTLFLALLDVSRSSEVNQSVHKIEHVQLNSEVLNKRLLPSVKHLMSGNSNGNREKFLRLLDGLQIDGFKFVDGEF